MVSVWIALDWLFTFALFTLTVILVKINSNMKKKKEILKDMPSYPGYLPIIGHAHLAARYTYSELIEEMTKIQKEVKGSVHIWLGPKLCGYVANPPDIENILNRKDALNKGNLFNFFQAHSVGLLSNTTPRWYRMRKLANIPLAHKLMIESFITVYQKQSRVLLPILAENEGKGYFDIYPYLSRCCQDITYGKSSYNTTLCRKEQQAVAIHLNSPTVKLPYPCEYTC